MTFVTLNRPRLLWLLVSTLLLGLTSFYWSEASAVTHRNWPSMGSGQPFPRTLPALRVASAPKASPRRAGGTPITRKLVIYATPYGFEPNQVQLPAGDVLIEVHNRTGLERVNYSFSIPSMSQASSFSIGVGSHRSDVFHLEPGKVFVSADNTETEFLMTVTQ